MSKNETKTPKSVPYVSEIDGISDESDFHPKELSREQKMNILKKCIPHAKTLFVKSGVNFSKEVQKKVWNKIAEDCESEGIKVGNGSELKNTARNWFNRVLVRHHECTLFVNTCE